MAHTPSGFSWIPYANISGVPMKGISHQIPRLIDAEFLQDWRFRKKHQDDAPFHSLLRKEWPNGKQIMHPLHAFSFTGGWRVWIMLKKCALSLKNQENVWLSSNEFFHHWTSLYSRNKDTIETMNFSRWTNSYFSKYWFTISILSYCEHYAIARSG